MKSILVSPARLGPIRDVFETSPKTKGAFIFMAVLALAFAALAWPSRPGSATGLVGVIGCAALAGAGVFLIWLGLTIRHIVTVHEHGLSIDVRSLKSMVAAYRWEHVQDAEPSVHRVYYKGVPFDTKVLTIRTSDGRTYGLTEHVVGDIPALHAAITPHLRTRRGTA